jgi:trk system potassium uptake protein TrkH
MLMFVGGCAGSTGGGMKIIRILFLFKLIRREISKIYHPRAMLPIRIGGKALSGDINVSIASFFALYVISFVFGTVIISLEGHGLVSSASAVAATIGNIGPGFDFVGPTQTYANFSALSKIFLSFLMLIGRLELYTVIALIMPGQLRERVFQ